MTWPIWCEIVCVKCANTTAGRFNYSSLKKNEMRNEAYREGWRITNDDWLCKECLKLDE